MSLPIVPLKDVDIRLVPGAWPLPPSLREQVAAHWAGLVTGNPHLWDGQILGVSAPGGGAIEIVDGVLRGEARIEAYSAFLAWRDKGFTEIGIRNLFGSGLIVSSDGALIYGRMGGTTANAGRVYPPAGSLEPRDIGPDGVVDVVGSIETEMVEETGLDPRSAQVGGMWAVFDGPRISIARLYQFSQVAEELTNIIRSNLERQAHRELDDVVVVRSGADAEQAGPVPPYALALAEAFGRGELMQIVTPHSIAGNTRG
jgi:hypothetical protein